MPLRRVLFRARDACCGTPGLGTRLHHFHATQRWLHGHVWQPNRVCRIAVVQAIVLYTEHSPTTPPRCCKQYPSNRLNTLIVYNPPLLSLYSIHGRLCLQPTPVNASCAQTLSIPLLCRNSRHPFLLILPVHRLAPRKTMVDDITTHLSKCSSIPSTGISCCWYFLSRCSRNWSNTFLRYT